MNLVNILVIPFLCNKVIAVLKVLRLILTLSILLSFETLLSLIRGKLSGCLFLKKTCKYGCRELRVIRKKSVELYDTKVAFERISKYVLVVTKRIIAVIALYL